MGSELEKIKIFKPGEILEGCLLEDYFVKHDDYPYLSTFGDTAEEALKEFIIVFVELFEWELEEKECNDQQNL